MGGWLLSESPSPPPPPPAAAAAPPNPRSPSPAHNQGGMTAELSSISVKWKPAHSAGYCPHHNTPEPSSSTKSLRLPSLSLTKKFSTTTTLPSSRTIFRFTPSRSNVRTCSGAIFNFPMEGDELCITFRSEEHTSQLQSLMRLSYAVFCLQKNIQTTST